MGWPAARGLMLIGALVLGGCGGTASPPAETSGDASSPELLPTPYTAEQIRDEWVPGLSLRVRSVLPRAEVYERWTVLSADEAGAEIEYVDLDDQGQTSGEPRTEWTSWTELRDHGSFEAGNAERERVSRETPLGSREGWLYRVHDEDEGTTTELFFADDFPGAPLYMATRRGDELLIEFEQLSRDRPGD